LSFIPVSYVPSITVDESLAPESIFGPLRLLNIYSHERGNFFIGCAISFTNISQTEQHRVSALHVFGQTLDLRIHRPFVEKIEVAHWSPREQINQLFEPVAVEVPEESPGCPFGVRWNRDSLGPETSLNHRGVALRIPLAGPEDTRIEHRPGGADGNPYLVMAAILAGIHHGITNRCDPGVPVAPGAVIEEKITLPVRWEAALDAFDSGTVLPDYLGKHYHELFASCRREECDRFHAQITDRDYEWYLRAI